MTRLAAILILATLLPQDEPEEPQENPSPLGGDHDSRDPRQCKACRPALEKALGYLRSRGPNSFTETMMRGWLGLVDKSGRTSGYVGKALTAASGARSAGFNGNWAIAQAGAFLGGAYYKTRNGKARSGLSNNINDAQRNQHSTGGWHHNKNFNMKGYAKDIAMLGAQLYTGFMVAKLAELSVPKEMLERAEESLEGQMDDLTGLGYGLGVGGADPTGSRGAYMLMGILMAGMADHKFGDRLIKMLPFQLKNMEKGHAVGCMHWLSVAVATYLLGQEAYDKFSTYWIDKLIAKQQADGGVLLGDDGAGGGEDKFVNGHGGSTAVFCLILMLQEPGVFDPPKPRGKKSAKKKARPGGSPFGRKKEPKNQETPGGKK